MTTPSNTIEELVGLQEHEARFRVRQIIANMASGSAEIEPYETLAGLGLDSLDLVELDVRIATEFGLLPHWVDREFIAKTTVEQVMVATLRALRIKGDHNDEA